MYNYRELNVLEYTLHLARRCSATVIDQRKSWLLYLQVIEDCLKDDNESKSKEQVSTLAGQDILLSLEPTYG